MDNCFKFYTTIVLNRLWMTTSLFSNLKKIHGVVVFLRMTARDLPYVWKRGFGLGQVFLCSSTTE